MQIFSHINTDYFHRPNADKRLHTKTKQAKTRAGGKVVKEDDDGEEEEALRSLLSLMILVFSG